MMPTAFKITRHIKTNVPVSSEPSFVIKEVEKYLLYINLQYLNLLFCTISAFYYLLHFINIIIKELKLLL